MDFDFIVLDRQMSSTEKIKVTSLRLLCGENRQPRGSSSDFDSILNSFLLLVLRINFSVHFAVAVYFSGLEAQFTKSSFPHI